MENSGWTLDELAERVDTALAVDYHGQPSRRVRAVPDPRAIRWYTTIGLIDRPVAHRGRTALYGPRHLLQLVAVKRLQADGLPLVAIQQQLAGATDTQLARVARLPAIPPAGSSPSPTALAAPADGAAPGKGRTARATPAKGRAALAAPAASLRPADVGLRRAGFWRQQPAPAGGGDPAGATATGPRPGEIEGATLRGVRLGEGVTLLLEPDHELDVADLRAIRDAAGPLLAALRARGLAAPNPNPTRDAGGRAENEPRREHP